MLRSCLILLAVLTASSAAAEGRRLSHCIAIADAAPGIAYLHRASFGTPLGENTVRLTFVDHATFLLETPGGLVAATDYTGYLGPMQVTPDVVTMNNAHETHFTAFPDPAIPHVLEGWARGGGAADHHLDLGEMLVRNVPTDIRGHDSGAVHPNGNSIFVFEVAGLCIGHLGHLHHIPDEAQFAALGRLDVVMAPVDGRLTLDLPSMIAVLTRLKSSVVIPMHWFGPRTLDRFLAGMADEFAVTRPGTSSLEVSLRTLPARPTVAVLEPLSD
ncbi:Zn-dependent hydrolase [Rhodovulum sulfidophilum]|uniref:L-ascorbate metabolism protein UlaG (Beta-lactamase superfamily) n=1 Tax=Rhodovulum visakhapatnamense TaxID=364297 RepID=A0A4V3GU35_9RHOB|nr:MBL fold metallo-hydrolase [Rhodovulum visakhapatnamense]MBL3568146.1 MBL fold metallo-hydrolase [Rhodovulum visakhapatnamense]MBL3579573.1 MBL fold metallo-hydrolase [Rhodovulum visakhapatnamense]OLS45320.1 Zn-dependent hydrolase [Rhodovulum sulfidophilum]TDX29279.1 L-ascorbate metabolism protein UlaG (beta-lactamase superfamily) [Rhodovulum visakhapatnamense]